MFEIAAAASLAGLALDAGSKYFASEGEAAAQEFKAEQAERKAEMGRLAASQLDAQWLEELNTTLAEHRCDPCGIEHRPDLADHHGHQERGSPRFRPRPQH